jgi:glucan phosphoethanolaminetransferase (alkaline phosphatase superfamily)
LVTAIVIFFRALVGVAGLIGTSGLFCTGRSKGANINHGLVLAATAASPVGGLYLILLIVLAVARRDLWSWRWRLLITGACVLEAAAVAVAIAFVALDSATYVSTDCSLMGPASNEVAHMQWLYYLLGFAVAALLFQALRVARYSPAPPAPEPDPDVSGPPLD